MRNNIALKKEIKNPLLVGHVITLYFLHSGSIFDDNPRIYYLIDVINHSLEHTTCGITIRSYQLSPSLFSERSCNGF